MLKIIFNADDLGYSKTVNNEIYRYAGNGLIM